MTEQNGRPAVSYRDLAAGAVMFMVGAAAGYQALGFDDVSRLFPAVTAALLAAAGLAIVVHAVMRPGEQRQEPGIGASLLACLAIAAWAIAFSTGAGFSVPTFLLQLALLRLAGVRNKLTLLVSAAIVTALAYLLFVALLDVPLPPSWLPAPLQGF